MHRFRNGIVVSRQFNEFINSVNNITSSFFFEIDQDGVNTKSINYIDVQDQMITYIDVTKYPDLTDELAFSEEFQKKRIVISPSRIFNKLFKKQLVDRHINNSDLEFFSNSFKSYFGPILLMKIVEGEDIRKYYYHGTYANGSGSLNKSCMRGSEYQKFLDIYVDNAKMLVGFDAENKVAARALLWDHVEMVTSEGTKFIKLMDRIYTAFDKDVLQVKKWAKENGYAYKLDQNHHEKENIVLGDDNLKAHLVLTIPDIEKYKKYPYIDTFSYGLTKTNLLSNKIYTEDSIELKRSTYYAPQSTYMNTNGWFHDNIEMWDHRSDNIQRRPPYILNLDYNKYIDWLNETFGYEFEKLDLEKIKENEKSQRILRNNRISEARNTVPTTITPDVPVEAGVITDADLNAHLIPVLGMIDARPGRRPIAYSHRFNELINHYMGDHVETQPVVDEELVHPPVGSGNPDYEMINLRPPLTVRPDPIAAYDPTDHEPPIAAYDPQNFYDQHLEIIRGNSNRIRSTIDSNRLRSTRERLDNRTEPEVLF
jgi:hypothetical protein